MVLLFLCGIRSTMYLNEQPIAQMIFLYYNTGFYLHKLEKISILQENLKM